MKQGLDLTESVFSGTAKGAAATMADLKQLRPKEASQITLGELKRWASIVRPSIPLPCTTLSCCWRHLEGPMCRCCLDIHLCTG